MSRSKEVRTVTRVVRTRIEFTVQELRKRLRLPDDAEVFMQVPGGGDWSNTDLVVEGGRPLIAVFERTTTEGGES